MLKFSVIVISSVYVVASVFISIVLLTCPSVLKHIVFMNMIKTQTNFTQTETFGIDRVQSFYLNVERQISLGIWHFRSPLIDDQAFLGDEDYLQKHFVSTPVNLPIILYFHDAAYDRSFIHRRELCKRLRDELKYDIVTFDYRGFGDSKGEPTESSLIKDARFIYDWIQTSTKGQRKIYLWGHSLGSAIAGQLAAQLSDENDRNLAGIVMEAPFINVHQAILTHWFSLLFRWQPWYYSLTEKALQKVNLTFDTRVYLSKMNCPCVLLHADDDSIVPYVHAKELLQTGMNARHNHMLKKKFFHFNIDMISFHRSGYGHKLIYQAPKLLYALKQIIFEEHL